MATAISDKMRVVRDADCITGVHNHVRLRIVLMRGADEDTTARREMCVRMAHVRMHSWVVWARVHRTSAPAGHLHTLQPAS